MSEAVKMPLRPDPDTAALNELDLMLPDLFHDDYHVKVFERLRAEEPIYRQEVEEIGTVWNVTKYQDIMAVDTDHERFSSEGSIVVTDQEEDFPCRCLLPWIRQGMISSVERLTARWHREILRSWKAPFAVAFRKS